MGPADATERLNGSPAVRVDSLSKNYGPLKAVDRVGFSIGRGEVFALLGPNGAGKTTLVSMLATDRRPTSGDAFVFGRSIIRERRWVERVIGVVPQDIALYPKLTARENLRFFGRMYEVQPNELEARIDELLELVGLAPRADDPVGVFSGGMKRRLNIAVALIHRPRLVLLDEPTAGVDPQSRERIFEIVRSLGASGTALLYTTHYLEEVEEICDRVAIMDAGKIVAIGSLETLLARTEGTEVVVVHGLPPEADLRGLDRVQSVEGIERSNSTLRIFAKSAARVLSPLSRVLEPHLDRVSVEIAPKRLGTLFLQLTGRTLRD
jgi:ABC-2 type transport system ATP-binding protein